MDSASTKRIARKDILKMNVPISTTVDPKTPVKKDTPKCVEGMFGKEAVDMVINVNTFTKKKKNPWKK
jgi:hypothetical protein